MTEIKRWHPTARMNQMVAYNGLIFTAGQVAEENAGKSVADQTAEILRTIDSLQLTDRQKVATPVNWNPGDPAIIVPSLSDEQAKALFPQGWKTVKPYLRVVDLSK